ncbi:MAG: COX15/CtaA family protein [Acidimicrobiia bacterium]
MVRRLSPVRYAWVTRAALTSLCVIVVSGAAVRLSGSGLGCADWPKCNDERFIDVSSVHGAIEQVNRLFTGVVTVLVMAAVLAARLLPERRRDLERLAWLLVVGVIGQIVLGGVVVLTDLNPVANQGHFVLSMFLVGTGLVLVRKAGGSAPRLELPVRERRIVRIIGLAAGCAILTGTAVTGAGPHAGDEDAPRLDVGIETVARVHGIAVMVALAAIVSLVVSTRRRGLGTLGPRVETLLAVGVLQATVGYVQYFNEIPALLVAVHVALATAFFLVVVDLWYAVAPAGDQAPAANRATVSR